MEQKAKIINKIEAKVQIFYSPLNQIPKFSGVELKKRENFYALEEFTMSSSDTHIVLSGAIKDDLKIKRTDDEKVYNQNKVLEKLEYSYTDNIVMFKNKFLEGEKIKILYKTDILEGVMPSSKWEKQEKIYIEHYERYIDYTHKWEYSGYYETPRNVIFNIGEIFSLDASEFSGCTITWYALSPYQETEPILDAKTYDQNSDFGLFLDMNPQTKELPLMPDSFGDVVLENVGKQRLTLAFNVLLKDGRTTRIKKITICPTKLEISSLTNEDLMKRAWRPT